jgi:fumarate hydratase class II
VTDVVEHKPPQPHARPEWARWGTQTQLAVQNFPISGLRIDRHLIRSLAAIKAEAALVNARLGVIDESVARAIHESANAVASGLYDDQFPVDVFQTGSGTSSNMNANEVIASLATETLGHNVHPNDHVNASQSSNDVVPTAIRIAAIDIVRGELLPACHRLEESLASRAAAFATVVKTGRTHLMDALPVTLGIELASYAAQVGVARAGIESALPRVGTVPLGGTAVGTGLNTPTGFAAQTVGALATRYEYDLVPAALPLAVQAAHDDLVSLSGALRTLAVALVKIANDVRWMSSGPRAGLAEIMLPELQAGSSMMPGKVNPVLGEVLVQVAAQVIGNDATIAFCGSQGNFELNVTLPVIAHDLYESIRLLSNAMLMFAERCVDGIEADVERCLELAGSSPAIATALAPALGYERVSDVVKQAVREYRTIRSVILERGLLDEATVDRLLDLDAMSRGESAPG